MVLKYQISKEEIPSFINDKYNCQVIAFLDVRVQKIKDASFVGGLLQIRLKFLCVIRIYDVTSEVYSFAHKRLNLQDASCIVVQDICLSKQMPVGLIDNFKMEFMDKLIFERIVNKNNKLYF